MQTLQAMQGLQNIRLINFPILFSIFPNLSFLWFANPKISECGRGGLSDKVRE